MDVAVSVTYHTAMVDLWFSFKNGNGQTDKVVCEFGCYNGDIASRVKIGIRWELSASRSGHFISDIHRPGRWVGPRTGIDAVEKRRKSTRAGNRITIPGRPVCSD